MKRKVASCCSCGGWGNPLHSFPQACIVHKCRYHMAHCPPPPPPVSVCKPDLCCMARNRRDQPFHVLCATAATNTRSHWSATWNTVTWTSHCIAASAVGLALCAGTTSLDTWTATTTSSPLCVTAAVRGSTTRGISASTWRPADCDVNMSFGHFSGQWHCHSSSYFISVLHILDGLVTLNSADWAQFMASYPGWSQDWYLHLDCPAVIT